MEYIFEAMFPGSYELLERMVSRFIQDGKTILDVGAGDGAVARVIERVRTGCQIICLEPDKVAYTALLTNSLRNNSLVGQNIDIQQYLKSSPSKTDYVIFHRTLHHLDISLNELFNLIKGTLVIGDPYFPNSVSQAEFALEMENLHNRSGHSHRLTDYHNPSQVVASAIKQGFELQYFDLLSEGEGMKQFYQMVLKRGET